MTRSVLAVLAGLVVLTVLSFAANAVVGGLLLRLFPAAFPDRAALNGSVPVGLLTIFYTMLSIAAGAYVTAWLAGRSPVKHAVIMGCIELAMTIGMMFQFLGKTPLWGWIVSLLLMVPAAWLGGRVQLRRVQP